MHGLLRAFLSQPRPFCERKPAFSRLFRDDGSIPGLGVGRGHPCAAPVRGNVSANRKSGTFQNMQRVLRTPASQSSSVYLLWEGEKLESSPQSRREHVSYRAGPGSWHRAGPRGLASDLLKQHPLICFMSKTAAPPGGPCPPRMLSHESRDATSAGSEKKVLL